MLICKTCESAQYLNITRSKAWYDDDGDVYKFHERIECVYCGSTGSYHMDLDAGRETIKGDLEDVPAKV